MPDTMYPKTSRLGAGSPSAGVAHLPSNNLFAEHFLLADNTLHDSEDIALLKPAQLAAWTVRDQGDRPTCIAYATAACIELLRAGAGTTFETLSPQYLYWYLRRTSWPASELPQQWNLGATKLEQAAAVLKPRGICRATSYQANGISPAVPEGTTPPSAPADLEAKQFRADGDYHAPTYGPGRDAGVARQIYDLLKTRGPVALAAPAFDRPEGGNTFQNPGTRQSGIVEDPRLTTFDSGHAVCLVGFQHASPDKEKTGGWFIFRNSQGLDFAADFAATQGLVPHAGYGAISATYVEEYCWEYLSLQL